MGLLDLFPPNLEREHRSGLDAASRATLHTLRHSPIATYAGASSTLVCGPAQSGKTYLLFSYATRLAAQGRDVVFLCPDRDRLRAVLPFLEHVVTAAARDASSDSLGVSSTTTGDSAAQNAGVAPVTFDQILKRIHIKYIVTSAKLRCFLASAHMTNEPASVVIVDDYLAFFGDANKTTQTLSHAVAKTSALLVETCNYLTSTHPAQPTTLLVADSLLRLVLPPPALVELLERWFPLVVQLGLQSQAQSQSLPPAAGLTHHSMTVLRVNKHDDPFGTALHFTLSANGLSLANAAMRSPP
ncbi:hypothetical protein CAOG_07084 [Capsaspora owczarzaki ATCC 30864]|uniref:hypothetical protein n=1 Tax=Capsaspora owczarzaki (strain ATCC 30864) TaxID=595528 RepID=UPI000352654E|nr:hypothetical protein CAOG_07084 [Capsaspora owczarzaki ATCC 30864]|eukprot:XP_004343808.2 hypothetical protein CAOG_07084 [Capsaspora owczarzaki ATCC 30864]